MQKGQLELGVVVLAAGAGSRFGGKAGGKLLADLGGRPLLSHVLAAVDDFGPTQTVVVLRPDAGRVEGAIDWSGQRRAYNPRPERGLASSLAIGLGALEREEPLVGAFVVLGDQPRLRPHVMRALADAAAAARPADRVYVVPRYAAQRGPRNPALLMRPAWTVASQLEGDRGLADLIDANPDQVLYVDVEGEMPDVDTPGDLERLVSRGEDPAR
jgi:CTP:molybdopterin cytidylyltransferase MocA